MRSLGLLIVYKVSAPEWSLGNVLVLPNDQKCLQEHPYFQRIAHYFQVKAYEHLHLLSLNGERVSDTVLLGLLIR